MLLGSFYESTVLEIFQQCVSAAVTLQTDRTVYLLRTGVMSLSYLIDFDLLMHSVTCRLCKHTIYFS